MGTMAKGVSRNNGSIGFERSLKSCSEMWEKPDNYRLFRVSKDQYLPLNGDSTCVVILEDDYLAFLVKEKMLEAGVKVVKRAPVKE